MRNFVKEFIKLYEDDCCGGPTTCASNFVNFIPEKTININKKNNFFEIDETHFKEEKPRSYVSFLINNGIGTIYKNNDPSIYKKLNSRRAQSFIKYTNEKNDFFHKKDFLVDENNKPINKIDFINQVIKIFQKKVTGISIDLIRDAASDYYDKIFKI